MSFYLVEKLKYSIYNGTEEASIMASKTKKNKFKYRLFFIIPACLCLLFAIFMYVGSYWVQIAEKYQEKQELESQILSLKEKEEALKVDVDKLQDPEYIARYAREKYLYTKEGELIIRIDGD